jgi:hypothetical protein
MDLRIEEIDHSVTGPFLEVVSDGLAIWYSAAAPDVHDPQTAPLLYRYDPGIGRPELVWQSDDAWSIVTIGGEGGTIAFAELNMTPGERAWNLWLIPNRRAEPILLDTYPGGSEVPGSVPSFDIDEGLIVWTSFDRGQDGPVSQMWWARQPDWEPQLLATRLARERELWLPSVQVDQVAFVEVVYNADRSADERHVLLMDLRRPGAEPRRLDTTGRATMPQLVREGVIWKETDPGMNMFNWGTLQYYTFDEGTVSPIDLGADANNNPSVGQRFLAAQSIDSSVLMVYDLDRNQARPVELHPPTGPSAADRPSVAGSLLVWVALEINEADPDASPPNLRWTHLPLPGADVRGFP